jgi:hypothetical protein
MIEEGSAFCGAKWSLAYGNGRKQVIAWDNLQCEYDSGSWAVINGILTLRAAAGWKKGSLA